MLDKDLETHGLTIVVDNAYDMAQFDKEEFIKIRRNGLGASDSSIVLRVNPFTTVDELINQKLSSVITEEEKAVGEKESVRKGADLEPLILRKFEEWSGIETYKPSAMYKLNEHPQLTVNFDGIIVLGTHHIPVEAKYVSPYANKYWDKSKRIDALHNGTPKLCAGANIAAHVQESAELYGIPPYYYTQVQQQLLALHAPFGYLVGLFDKGWEIGVYKIFADVMTQNALISNSLEIWNTVQERKRSS